MSLAIPQPRPPPPPTSSSSSLATRPAPTMLPKQPTQKVQPRPSSSGQRPMMPRPKPSASSSQLTPAARPLLNSSVGSSSSMKIPLPPKSTTTTTTPSAPSPSTRPAMPSRTSSTASTPTASSSAAAAVAPLMVPGKDTSSSAGKIFAKPSKEWVLPERAKPGRKVSVEEPDNKRQSQNRLSQRAHRARRTDYIQTLEERLRQYEADEIHSNVRLQEVARALKTDNERLKNELNNVQNQLLEFNNDRNTWEAEKRSLGLMINQLKVEVESLKNNKSSGMSPSTTTTIVRMELDQNTIDSLVPGPSPVIQRRQSLTHRASYNQPNNDISLISTSTTNNQTRQRRDTLDCPICPNPDPDCPCQQGSSSSSTVNQAIRRDVTLVQPQSSSCGLCHSTDECLCRVVVNQDQNSPEDIKPIILSSPNISSPTKSLKSIDDGCGLCAGGGFCACRAASETQSNHSGSSGITKAISIANSSSSSASIPPPTVVRATSSASAIPLRLKSKSTKSSIWTLNNAVVATSPKKEAVCTGDPDNCDACKNDSFGREFCQHLFEDAHPDATEGLEGSTTKKGCGNCSGPNGCMSIKSLLSPSQNQNQQAGPSSTKAPTPPPAVPVFEDDEPTILAPLQMACCGNPELCGGNHGHSSGCTGEIVLGGPASSVENQSGEPMIHVHIEGPGNEEGHETLRPDQAWKQLKAHPNAKFASLALLADVVARRTNVLGGFASPSPSPMPPSPVSLNAKPLSSGSTSASLSYNHHQNNKKRGFDIETSAVREALKMLDKATPGPESEGGDERDGKRRRI
ncbi:hypothetical protein I302_106799 [Kwoniella bestiolae CBS 10118]|uniref:BZIP domain-containing protein n=1 Tax=Kwoniella bestiolae CBS 10118 TaxID=1296100 RepID=A0A1B9G0D0_9TREE|nr:hypothetical protein I302_05935 [Kwoniella bestiolae CBS 10118]OCF24475.1 hypothetical protein I302_05935 [Kwoniella bestiolae CBS 10118]